VSERFPPGFEALVSGGNFDKAFGTVLANIGAGKLGFRVGPHHLNPNGSCHGGAIATFADMQVLIARAGPGSRYTPTISLSIDYLAAAQLDDWIEADVTCVKTTRNMIFSQALITANGELVARTTAIYKNTPYPAAAA